MTRVEIDAGRLLIDGEARVLLCASLFPFRVPREEWGSRIAAVAALGYHCLDVYVPWNFHERPGGGWDFTAQRDLALFLEMAADAGLFVLARPGPYICSEWDGGGIPARLAAMPSPALRQNDPGFLAEVARWFAQVMPILADHQADRGGSVVAVQLDNELDFFDCDDPEGYIAALRDLAAGHGIRVPLIACAGQGDVQRSGGWVEGVVPAVNLYPDDAAPEVEALAEHYAAVVGERGFPLIATETNRLHRTLKRLLVGGVKVLGPYLQASGWNFGAATAVNNWGDILGFLAHDYDFDGVIRPDGTERPDAADARRLAGTVDALGVRLAAGTPAGPASGVSGTGAEVHALALDGGGELLAVCALGDRAERYRIAAADGAIRTPIEVDVAPGDGLLLVRDLPVGPGLRIALTTAELVRWDAGEEPELRFAARGVETVVLEGGPAVEAGDGARVATDGSSTTVVTGPGVVRVQQGDRSWRLVFEAAEQVLPEPGGGMRSLSQVGAGAAEHCWASPVATREPPALERIGVLEGAGRYSAAIDRGALHGLVLRAASDIVSVDFDHRPGHWQANAGTALWVPGPSADVGRIDITARIWGHANFDDGRLPSLGLGSGRGVTGVLAVREEIDIRSGWRVLGGTADGGDIAVGHPRPLASPGGWMTASFPQRIVYRLVMARRGGAALRFRGNAARIDVRLNGVPLGVASPLADTVWLGSIAPGDELDLEVLRAWGEPVGGPELLLGEEVHEWTVERQDPAVLAASRASAELSSHAMPLAAPPGRGLWVHVSEADLAGHTPSAVVRFEGEGLHVTALCGPDVLGRLWLPAPPGATVKGGRGDLLIVPRAWCDRALDLLVESTGEGPGELRRITVGGPVDLG